MSRDVLPQGVTTNRAWIAKVASACFVEELDIEALPLSEPVKGAVRCILEELAQLSPLEALSRCLSTTDQLSARGL